LRQGLLTSPMVRERESNQMRPFKVLDKWQRKTDKDLERIREEQREMRARLAVLEKRRQVMRREYNG
jgi:hypothetical protein